MTIKKDFSYGIIPVHKNELGTWEVFLINQIPRRGNLFWTFPKGHPEAGETQKETALRELAEEAGMVPDFLEEGKTFIQQYVFKHEGQTIDKKVEYYLGFVSTKEYKIRIAEVKEAGWFSFAEARNILTHDIAKELLDEVAQYQEVYNA